VKLIYYGRLKDNKYLLHNSRLRFFKLSNYATHSRLAFGYLTVCIVMKAE